jgi:DNA-directed RNA polymerase subunit F
MDKVKQLLSVDEARGALYDFLKARAEEVDTTVEELVVRVIQQYKEQVEHHKEETKVFREKVESQEKQEALRKIEGILDEADFHQGAILEIARLVPKAQHNVPVITHTAYLASRFGYHTGALIQIAQMASVCHHDCEELQDLAELVVLKLSGTLQVIRLAESAVKAQSEEEKKHVRQEIEELRSTADYGSIQKALEG